MLQNLEIRVLVCEKDMKMCENMIISLQKYTEFQNCNIFFHNDGSLKDESRDILSNFKNSIILDKEYANSRIFEHIKDYPFCQKYRLNDSPISLWHKFKLFDFYLFSKTKNILCIDSDVLFIHKPEILINLIDESIPFYFPDFLNSYSFSKNSKIEVLPRVNTGIFYIPSNKYYDLNFIELALQDLYNNGMKDINWIEQSAYAHMFYKIGDFIPLNQEKYMIPTSRIHIPENIEALHFVGHPPIRKLYDEFKESFKF